MPSKIKASLSPEKFKDFCREISKLDGGALDKNIQRLAAEWGVEIGLDSAYTFRDGDFREFLEEMEASSRFAQDVAAVVKNGVGLSDAATAAFASKVFDRARKIKADEIGSGQANNVSLAIARLRTGDQRARFLQSRLQEMHQKMELVQFDAAAAVLEHAKEIKLVVADTKLDGAAKTERVRKILFGERPADWTPIAAPSADPT
jgi:hypothetical protein